jgi:hypothetical protein
MSPGRSVTDEELRAHDGWRNFGDEVDNHPPIRGWLAVPSSDRTARIMDSFRPRTARGRVHHVRPSLFDETRPPARRLLVVLLLGVVALAAFTFLTRGDAKQGDATRSHNSICLSIGGRLRGGRLRGFRGTVALE